MNAPIKAVVVDREELDVRTCATLVRVLATRPSEKKLQIFVLLAGVAAENLADRRRQYVDDLVAVAEAEGLIRFFGRIWVMDAITRAFSRSGL
jgi:hypothetical protein